jgi:hypothetical protein
VWARVETKSVNPSVAKVIITISLGTAEITPPFFGGRVRVGLKRVKLRLCAEGGEILHENRWPSEHEAETSIRVEVTEEKRQRRGVTSTSRITAKAGAGGATGEATTEGFAKLTFAKLTEAHLMLAKLTGADLMEADLTGADLTGADLTGANLMVAKLTEAHLERAKLTGARLTFANLTEAHLERADLTGADLTGG